MSKEKDPRVLKQDVAMRVIFFYPGEEGTYIDNANVTLYDSGIVDVQTENERVTSHLSNVEILWFFEDDGGGGQRMKAVPA